MTGAQPGFVGRAAETARLLDLVATADRRDGRPVPVAVLVGEPGIGKTKLADEVAATMADHGWRLARAEADVGDQTPFAALAGLRRELGIDARVDPSLPASEQRWETLLQLAGSLASVSPVIVVIDDVQWLDDASRWVVDRLARQLAGHAVAIVATSRPPEAAGPDPLGRLRRDGEVMALDGLDPAALDELAVGLGRTGVDVGALAHRTGGNPLFARELLVAGDAIGLPHAIGAVLRASLDRLDEQTREVLAVAAVAGVETPVAVLAAALDRPVPDVAAALDEARAAEVLDPRATEGLRFRHVLLAEAAQGLVTPAATREHHLELARAWRARGGAEAATRVVSHELRALPLGDPLTVVTNALVVAGGALRAGDAVVAGAVYGLALAGLEAHAPDAVELRVAALVEQADALVALGDLAGAHEACAAAVELGGRIADPELKARAEIGAARQMNMHQADPARQLRLEHLERELPAGDRRDRVALLGRIALLRAAADDDVTEAHHIADRAVAMARRIGDTELLIDVLCDRHQVVVDLDGLDRRSEAADEIVELARRAGEPALGMRGHEWQFTGCLERGDGVGAARALDHVEAVAALLPSPLWRFGALIRRVTLLSLAGDRDGALALIDDAVEIGAVAVDEMQVTSLEVGLRFTAQVQWGLPDESLVPLMARLASFVDQLPMSFFRIRLAMGQLAVGHPDDARRIVERYVNDVDAIAQAAEGISTLAILASLVAELEMMSVAPAVLRALSPYSGVLGTGNGVGFDAPVDAVLGRLALLTGDVGAAIEYLQAGLDFAQRFPSPVMEARVGWWLADALAAGGDENAANTARSRAHVVAADHGIVLGTALGARPETRAVSSMAGPRQARLRRVPDGWSVTSPFGDAALPGSRGLEQLAAVLSAPDHQISAVHLAGGVADAPVEAGLGPALDARAKHAYRTRVRELQVEIDAADERGDPAASARAHGELEALMDELRRAVGLGGRDRPIGSGAERARINVTRSLKRAVASIGAVVPELGEHLGASLQTGSVCAYRPDPERALDWTVER